MSSVKTQINKLSAMSPPVRRGFRKLFPAALIVILSLAVATMLWEQEAYAGARASGAPGTCAAGSGFGPRADNGSIWEPATKAISDIQPLIPAQGCDSNAATQENDIDPQDIVVWSAMLTVGQSDIASIGYQGFITGDWPDTGSIDDVAFTRSGVDYIVTALYHPIVNGNPNHLFFHMDKPLPEGFTLRVGPDYFADSHAEVLGAKRNIYHWYLDASLGWIEGENVPVSLTAAEESNVFQEALVKELTPAHN